MNLKPLQEEEILLVLIFITNCPLRFLALLPTLSLTVPPCHPSLNLLQQNHHMHHPTPRLPHTVHILVGPCLDIHSALVCLQQLYQILLHLRLDVFDLCVYMCVCMFVCVCVCM